jgi:pimeloyl-ACP methyl ester carboxylesterase
MSRAVVQRGYANGPHGQIHYRLAEPAEPAATPLLCMHQSPHSGLIFEPLIAAMGNDRIALAPDTPGFGLSDPPERPPEIADYAAAMAALLDDLGIPQVDVMGYHTGADTAVAMALAYPERVQHVVMISAPIYTTDELAARRDTFGPSDPIEDGRFWQARWQRFRQWWPEQGIAGNLLTNFFVESQRNPDYSWWGHRAAFSYPLADVLPRVQQPLLILNPEDDLWPVTPRAAPLLSNGRIHDLPGWGHGFMHLHTDAVAQLLRDFLDQPSRP